MEQRIKQDTIYIGANIRRIRLEQGEMLVKIERGIHHIPASMLRAIRDCLHTTYDELLK